MTADDDMFYFENIDSELYDRETIQIRVDHKIRDVAVNKNSAGRQINYLISRYPAIGTTNP